MVDTIRDKDDLLVLLANNTTGNISPQDIRDMLVSLFGVFGIISVKDGATAQAGVTTTPEKMTGFATNGPAVGITVDHTDDSMTILTDGYYLLLINVSFSGTNNSVWDFEFAVDGVAVDYAFKRKISTTGDVGDASAFGIIQGTAAEVVSILVNSANAGGDSFTPVHSQFAMVKLA